MKSKNITDACHFVRWKGRQSTNFSFIMSVVSLDDYLGLYEASWSLVIGAVPRTCSSIVDVEWVFFCDFKLDEPYMDLIEHCKKALKCFIKF